MSDELAVLRMEFENATGLTVERSFRESSSGVLERASYVIVYGLMPERLSERFSQVATSGDRADFEVPFKVVGTSYDVVEEALAALEGLQGARLTVYPRSCSPLRLSSELIKKDTSVRPGLFFADGLVKFTSRRGPM